MKNLGIKITAHDFVRGHALYFYRKYCSFYFVLPMKNSNFAHKYIKQH